ncbi:hypothetical protein IGI65_001675 [Enterococcus sp. DIV0755b]|uniref:PBECR4 domain-containing protein n=1 Tax=Enterococcus sp. DIV0755b TaxID=2774657 RepID=UPI003F24DDAC
MAIDLKFTYNQYLSNFDGKVAMMTTSYDKLDVFYVKFDIKQLPHLLGLHKIYNRKPQELCKDLRTGDICYENIQRHHNFGQIKDRITLFPFILDIFLEDYNKSVIYLSDGDKNGSSMNLDIAFAHPYKNKYLNLGLRENTSSVYAPVTFFVNKKKKSLPFPGSKRARVETIEIIETNSQQLLF